MAPVHRHADPGLVPAQACMWQSQHHNWGEEDDEREREQKSHGHGRTGRPRWSDNRRSEVDRGRVKATAKQTKARWRPSTASWRRRPGGADATAVGGGCQLVGQTASVSRQPTGYLSSSLSHTFFNDGGSRLRFPDDLAQVSERRRRESGRLASGTRSDPASGWHVQTASHTWARVGARTGRATFPSVSHSEVGAGVGRGPPPLDVAGGVGADAYVG
ncbi:hypothetical protein B296_00045029 [Ensete ventricosum]|uniref:Uncharacterized protein n=1 Tax=Ensete ventricosum TaxID=4639 RepID=A0A426XH58_ENSVE|nr:hypothetical protein B296_00045029 [Ensete ventricosum]